MSEEREEVNLVMKSSNYFPLLALPDEILLSVFKYLDPRDLLNLIRSCERLNVVARYSTLWSKVDLRSHCMMLCQLKEYAEYFHPTTKFIALKGCVRLFKETILHHQNCSSFVLKSISEICPNLETLILEEHYFDATKVSARHFPSSLRNLTLKDCEVYGKTDSFFYGVHDHMPYLEVLSLDGSKWLPSSFFLSIRNCQSLRKLSMKSCPNTDHHILHTAFGVFNGFKSLKILDVRGTLVSDGQFCLLSSIVSLTHLLVEHPCPKKVSQAESVNNSEEAGNHSGRVNQLPARVTSSCGSEAEPAEPEELQDDLTDEFYKCYIWFSKWITLSFGPMVKYFAPGRCVSDWSVMRLGMDIKNMIDRAFTDDFISANSKGFNHHLTHLLIKNYEGVTDKSLEYLSGMSSLKSLNVKGTSVTPNGISRFCTMRPDVRVESDFEIN